MGEVHRGEADRRIGSVNGPVAVHPDAVQVQDLTKTFRVPIPTGDGVRGRLARRFERSGTREMRALDGVSFDVQKGEFFGIAGRNGSGKSTLLKLIAGIHAADRGAINVAGRVGPFLELGVGFNQELSARENVVINGVMLGRTPEEMMGCLDSVLEFADLGGFADAKLKHFSSGMRLRLGFSVMVQADPDVYLFDEVISVGDAAFQQRASETFSDLKERGKTVILVTHSMAAIEQLCDRAMLLEQGQLAAIGATDDVTARYLELNREQAERRPGGRLRPGEDDGEVPVSPRLRARVASAHVVGSAEAGRVDPGEPISLEGVVIVERPILGTRLWLELRDAHGTRLFADSTGLDESGRDLAPGQRLSVRAAVENRLAPGSYTLSWALMHTAPSGDPVVVSAINTRGFRVAGKRVPRGGPVSFKYEVDVESTADEPAAASR
jgi:ABC-type polysaccharide/polyol phosphate transport system ATPase subunit